MDAYNVKLVDDNGKLLVDDPKVQAGPDRRAAATTPTSTPAAARRRRRRSWKDPDNNVAFHNKTIAADAQRDDLDRRQVARRHRTTRRSRRSSARRRRRTTTSSSRTAGFPNKPDGTQMVYRAAVKTGVIFEDAKNKARAKEFVHVHAAGREPARRTSKGALGRWFPVTKAAQESPFWQADRAPQGGVQPVQGRHGDRSSSPRTTSSPSSTTRTSGPRR